MKKLTTTLLIFIFSISIAFTQTIPQKISYQGKLMESGVAVNGQKNFVFSIPGTAWTETHNNVQVANGLYSVQLGSTTPIPVSVFTDNSSLALQIVVEGTTLAPQTEIVSVAYAFKAEKAADADKIGGSSVSTTAPTTAGQVLKWNGTAWAPGTDEVGGAISLSGHNATELDDISNAGSGSIITTSERSKLNGVASGADVTDATNVATAGAVMDGDFTANGLMQRTAAGTYSSVTNNSTNWNNAYSERLRWDGGVTGLNATTARTSLGLTIGTNVQGFDSDLQDLADGSLTGSKVGSGINASNITSGTLSNNQFNALSDLGGGSGTEFLRKDGTWTTPSGGSTFKAGQYVASSNNSSFSITTNLGQRPKKVTVLIKVNASVSKAEWYDENQDGQGVLMTLHTDENNDMKARCLTNTNEIGRIQRGMSDAQDFTISTSSNSITINKGTVFGSPSLSGLIEFTWHVE